MTLNYIKAEIISLKNHPIYNEKWLQNCIQEDPSILGLGDLDFKYTEKIQINGGRLDTILYDSVSNKRYEVEIQLGATDEKPLFVPLNIGILNVKEIPNMTIVQSLSLKKLPVVFLMLFLYLTALFP